MPNVNDVLNLMPQPDNKRKVYYQDGSNRNIIKVLESKFPEACKITERCSKLFIGSNDRETANNVWDFLKTNIEYRADGMHSQDIRKPNYFLQSGIGDCKSFALFSMAVLTNCGLQNCRFRYVSFNTSRTPTHVYMVCDDENGNEIIVDPVYKYFDAQASFTYKIDHAMEVAVMGYIPSEASNEEKAARVKAIKNRLKSLPVESNERAFLIYQLRQIKNSVNGIGKFNVKTIPLAPGRNAYLEIIRFNFRGIAKHLALAISKDVNKVKSKWEKLGGNYSALVAAINAGKDKKPLFGENDKWDAPQYVEPVYVQVTAEQTQYKKDKASGALKGIGFTVAALVAAASPVILAIAPLIKELVPSASTEIDTAVDAVSNQAKYTIDENTVPSDDESQNWFSGSTFGISNSTLAIGAGGFLAYKFLIK